MSKPVRAALLAALAYTFSLVVLIAGGFIVVAATLRYGHKALVLDIVIIFGGAFAIPFVNKWCGDRIYKLEHE
jgi:hypothetical protein